MVGLDDLKDIFQPKWFCDSVTARLEHCCFDNSAIFSGTFFSDDYLIFKSLVVLNALKLFIHCLTSAELVSSYVHSCNC